MISQPNSVMAALTLNLLRMVTGWLFLAHGLQKVFGLLGRENPAELLTLTGAAGVLELVGGTMIVLGLFTRPTAFILSGQMAFAYFLRHFPSDPIWPILNRGELAALYCFLFLFLAFNGGGEFSLDGWMRRRSLKR